MTEIESAFINVPPGEVGNLIVGRRVYVHWAVKNLSPNAEAGAFQVSILIDGKETLTTSLPGAGPEEIVRQLNAPLTISEPGTHIVELVVDSAGGVSETDEFDNIYKVTLPWLIAEPTPTSTPTP